MYDYLECESSRMASAVVLRLLVVMFGCESWTVRRHQKKKWMLLTCHFHIKWTYEETLFLTCVTFDVDQAVVSDDPESSKAESLVNNGR